ncbi:FRRS1-like protein [Mya arenaria]|uniref:FRRS1-like protein n=1 Tax=Mya arenaria TaxID=6604 RepID=A0ABY7DX13_MYAAR|nr:FRRS1-like protein [Mya arenaria]
MGQLAMVGVCVLGKCMGQLAMTCGCVLGKCMGQLAMVGVCVLGKCMGQLAMTCGCVLGTISRHSERPVISQSKIDFLSLYTGDSSSGTTDGPVGVNMGYNIHIQLLIYTWSMSISKNISRGVADENEADDVVLSLTCARPLSGYCAIGLSSDDKMGDDSVIECVSIEDRVDQQYGLSNMTTKNEDGVLTCKFSRKKVYQAKKKRATGPGPDTFFDMNKDWTLLYAYGKASSGFLNKHDVRPLTSDQKADFQSFMEIGASANDLLYKVHGILMVLAWMLMASAGIFMARFYKEVWPEGMEWCNLKRWFVPLMAMCRPKPGESKRVLFNVAHGSAGSIAHTLSIVNLFSGLWLAEESVTANTNIVLWVFVGWIIFIHTSSHIYDCVKRRDQKNITQKSYNKVDKSPDAGKENSDKCCMDYIKQRFAYIKSTSCSKDLNDKDDGDIPILRYDNTPTVLRCFMNKVTMVKACQTVMFVFAGKQVTVMGIINDVTYSSNT